MAQKSGNTRTSILRNDTSCRAVPWECGCDKKPLQVPPPWLITLEGAVMGRRHVKGERQAKRAGAKQPGGFNAGGKKWRPLGKTNSCPLSGRANLMKYP